MARTFNVTSRHINNGKRQECRECPVAMAIEEQMPRSKPVVNRNFILLTTPSGDRIKIELPKAVKEFVDAFDGKRPVYPFEFTLDIAAATVAA